MKKIASTLAIALLLCSCSASKIITGNVTAVNTDTVTITAKIKFKILKDTMPAIGKLVTFTPTMNKKKVNAIIVKQ